jgi:predicted deacetylase
MNQRTLCVSIHDVSPQTWASCRKVIDAVRKVADLPFGLLLVPCWHHRPWPVSGVFIDEIDAMRRQGHELVLHGYTHWDEGAEPRGLMDYCRRRIVTRHEGEFAALDVDATRAALQAGLASLSAYGWSIEGFVAPAWMLSASTVPVLAHSGLRYAGLLGGLLTLPDLRKFPSLALTYSCRHPAGDWLMRRAVSAAALAQARSPLLRVALHPADASRPANLRHAQRLIEAALKTRAPLTEAEYLRQAVIN